MGSDAKRSRWVAKMSPILVSRSLLTDSQEALQILVTGNTCPIRVSKSLEKLHNSLHKKVLSLRLAGEYWSRSKFAARRGGLELELERCSGRWRSAVAGRTCPCPLPRRLPRAATLPANIIITINILLSITIATIIIIIIIIN